MRQNKSSCLACGGLNGWWCRGCGGSNKIEGMIQSGIEENLADSIYDEQFGCCSKPLVPCYVCNK